MDKKVKNCQIGKAKYRTNGYILDLIFKSLEITNIEPGIQKNYQRVISEEDISIEEYDNSLNTIIDDIVSEFFKSRENENFKTIERNIKEFLSYYTLVTKSNETLKCSQKQLDYIELVFTFIPLVALIATDTGFVSIMPMPQQNKTTFQQLFELIDKEFLENKRSKEIIHDYFKEEKYKGYDTIIKSINGWFSGTHIPDYDHIKMISESLVPHMKDGIFTDKTIIYSFLLLSKIIQKLYNKSKEYFGQELTSLLVEHYIFICVLELRHKELTDQKLFHDTIVHNYSNSDAIIHYLDKIYYKNRNLVRSLTAKVSYQNHDVPNWQRWIEKFIFDSHQQIKILHMIDEKTFFDNILPVKFFKGEMQKEALSTIDESYIDEDCKYHDELLTKMFSLTLPSEEKSFENEQKLLSLKKEFSQKFETEKNPYYNFIEARYYAQKRAYKKATSAYLQALKYGKKCIGKHIESIIREGFIVSSLDTNKKQLDLKNAKSPFTKFYKEAYLNELIRSLPDAINQFLLNDAKKQFDNYFIHLYPDENPHKSPKKSMLGKIKPVYSKPNKVIRNVMENPISQLYYFCMEGKYKIIKKLISLGADINYQREFDNSTILMATVNSPEIAEDEIVKIINLFIKEMGKDIINAKLTKKNFSALYTAINKGYLDVVALLLENETDINQLILTDEYTPLYHTIYCIYLAKSEGRTIPKNFMFTKDHIEQMMRGLSTYNILLDSDKMKKIEDIQDNMKDPYFNELHSRVHEGYIDANFEGTKDISKLYQIFDLILKYKPDLELRKSPYRLTPLMYATEIGEVTLVKKLLDAGADKSATVSNTLDDKIKYTALCYVKQSENKELMELLK